MNDFLQTEYYQNSILTWIISIAIIVFGFALIRVLKNVFLRRLKKWSEKTETTLDDFAIKSIEKSIIPFLYFLIIYIALINLTLPARINNIIHVAMLFVGTFLILRLITAAIQYFIFNYLKKQDDGDVKQRQAKGLIIIVNAVIWTLGMVFLIDNLGYDVTTIVAGLGIGGIAIALAAQAILGDLFSYFVILFDRPFEIGDFIIVDDKSGIIEYIGIKTTRIRTLGGEQLVCSNTDLTDARVHNYKRMEKRRIVFSLGVTYQTDADTVEQIPGIVKDIITEKEDVTYDRGHFSGFGDFSLNFEFVYFIMSSDYATYMNRQQSIYLEIFRAFEERGIEFAYPTQTLFLTRESKPVEQPA